MPVRFGAIYFPAYSGQSRLNPQWYLNNQLSPAQYQTRAPWFAQQLSAQTMYINAIQADIDQDCIYAANGGIKYWVYGWYANAGEPNNGTNSLQTEWKLYQASPNKGLVNWCLDIGMQGFNAYVNTDQTTLLNYVLQSTYEKVLGNRPLIYFGSNEGGNTTGVAAAITTFNATCTANGLGIPYYVVMNFDPATAATAMTTVGAHAITTYARAFGGGGSRVSFSTYIADQGSQWNAWKAQGKDCVLNLTAGWNLNPIGARGYPGDGYGRAGIEAHMYDRVEIATPAELVTLATNAKASMAATPAQFPANTALWYAWSEHNEGGFLRPTWSSTGPNKTRLDALASVHNS